VALGGSLLDIETCPECGGKLRVIACIEVSPLIRKTLEHIQRREALTSIAARGPPMTLHEELMLT
jgi:uncharacterized protein YbaR (Trm112 family)